MRQRLVGIRMNVLARAGKILRALSRLCFSHVRGRCWNCGCPNLHNSVFSGGLSWCDDCHKRWKMYLGDKRFTTDWRGIGRPKRLKGLIGGY
jgi:hypothetical protein